MSFLRSFSFGFNFKVKTPKLFGFKFQNFRVKMKLKLLVGEVTKIEQIEAFFYFIHYNGILHGQTSANRTKPGPSFQLQKLLFEWWAFFGVIK